MLKHSRVVACSKRDHRKPLLNIIDEQHGLFARHAISSGHAGQGGIHFDQTMSAAAGLFLRGLYKRRKTCFVMRMIAVEYWNQN